MVIEMKTVIDKQVLSLLEKYIDDIFWVPREDLTDYSYKTYAAKKLYNELLVNDIPPLITIEKFRDKMDKYASLNTDTEIIFLTGKEVAEYFIRLLI